MNQIHFITANKAISVYIENQQGTLFHLIEVFGKTLISSAELQLQHCDFAPYH